MCSFNAVMSRLHPLSLGPAGPQDRAGRACSLLGPLARKHILWALAVPHPRPLARRPGYSPQTKLLAQVTFYEERPSSLA